MNHELEPDALLSNYLMKVAELHDKVAQVRSNQDSMIELLQQLAHSFRAMAQTS